VAGPTRFELATSCVTGKCMVLLDCFARAVGNVILQCYAPAAKCNTGYTKTGGGSSASWATAADAWLAESDEVASLFSADNFILNYPATGN
jgi:hypothetical protein